ncbi:MAG: aminotransferase class III-fold pyridoxal phosphate-dependent enzyme, partial [Candidatus Bathyarchaeia archaeon]
MSEKAKTSFSEETDPTARPWWYRGIVATRAKDCIVWDNEGRSFIDCTSSFFVMNLGHNHPEVVEELK